jgi:SNF2 family DNA or RNA helicase
MSLLSKIGQGGILADDMGLGKTIQTLAFTASLDEKGPTLVICPTSLIYNWQNEIQKFLPTKTSIAYTGTNRHKELNNFENTDYIICSYGIIKNDIDHISSIHYKAIIIDEAQYIKNPQAQISQAVKELSGNFKLAMTGTPIENSLQDIWNLFDFVMPGFLGTKNEFDFSIRNDDLSSLKARVKPFVLRREKREVLDSLPEKTEIIQKCPLSDEQMALYKSVLEQTKQSMKSNNKINILTALLKLRQVCSHPAIIPELKDMNIPSAKFELITEKLVELIAEGHKVVLFSQFTTMLDVFEKWTKTEAIHFERIDGSISSEKRIQAVKRFQESTTPTVFLISLKAGGVGLNLTAADYVIHVDPWWNPAVESQATDRVHRMGQLNKVIVYKFICQGTIEETIQELQEEKRQLLQEIVDVDGIQERQIKIDDIKNLLFS